MAATRAKMGTSTRNTCRRFGILLPSTRDEEQTPRSERPPRYKTADAPRVTLGGWLPRSPRLVDGAPPDAARPAPTLRVESAAVYLALIAGAIGALYGLVIAILFPDPPLRGEWSFGVFAAIGSGIIAAGTSWLGYWRSRHRPGQEW